MMPTRPEEEVLEAERQWLEAHRELDVEALDRLMHEDYTQIQGDGAIWNKDAALKSYQSGGRRWEWAESDELVVRVYGEAAVVKGRWRAKGVNQGERFDYAARYVSVWVKEWGWWQMVSDQSTEIEI